MIVKIPAEIPKVKEKIEEIYALSESNKNKALRQSHIEFVDEGIGYLDRGHIRVAEKTSGQWVVNDWVKKLILLYFKAQRIFAVDLNGLSFADKIPVKQWKGTEGVRVVPPAVARRGAYIGKKCVLMPSFVNIGAYVGNSTMIDTWATVGSCAQIGDNVHISGGVGIGGVLEPVQASPVIIEDGVFIGSRCVIVEGIVVEENAVIGAGVVLTSTTKIIDVSGSNPAVLNGRIPRNAVVIPGITSKEFPAGTVGVPCALIIGQRKESTDRKTSLNLALREFDVSV